MICIAFASILVQLEEAPFTHVTPVQISEIVRKYNANIFYSYISLKALKPYFIIESISFSLFLCIRVGAVAAKHKC